MEKFPLWKWALVKVRKCCTVQLPTPAKALRKHLCRLPELLSLKNGKLSVSPFQAYTMYSMVLLNMSYRIPIMKSATSWQTMWASSINFLVTSIKFHVTHSWWHIKSTYDFKYDLHPMFWMIHVLTVQLSFPDFRTHISNTSSPPITKIRQSPAGKYVLCQFLDRPQPHPSWYSVAPLVAICPRFSHFPIELLYLLVHPRPLKPWSKFPKLILDPLLPQVSITLVGNICFPAKGWPSNANPEGPCKISGSCPH